ncbi:uncharacterized mitochondrial protein-like protein [Tanacetum coccineum]
MQAVKEKEQLQKIVDSWKDSSKNLWKLVDSGMSSTSKVGLGYEIKSNDETDSFKGVPHPLTGDYTPKPQQEIDESLYVYGKKGPQKPEISVSDDTFSENSVTTNEKVVSEPKPTEVEPSCKMAREAELKKQRVFNTGNGVAKPVWNNANMVNHANHFIPRPVRLIVVRQNVRSVRPNVNTVRANVNSVRTRMFIQSDHPHIKNMEGQRPIDSRTLRHMTDLVGYSSWLLRMKLVASFRTSLDKLKTQLNHRVKIIRSDNGTEFKNKDILEFCRNNGIKQEYSNARTPQQNGVAERMNRILIENQTNPHAGTSEVTNSAGTLQTPNANASEEEDELRSLLLEDAYSIGLSKNTPEILAFRRELDELAPKHLREVPKNKATNMPELTIFNKPQKGIFNEASYDDEGAHALEEPKKISKALKEDSWVKAMQEELLIVIELQQVTPKTSHLNVVKRIFKYLKGKPNLGLWYPRESSFDLEAYSDSDYDGANHDRKSITGGCQFLRSRLISWQCKKQTIVATSTTEAEYVALQVALITKADSLETELKQTKLTMGKELVKLVKKVKKKEDVLKKRHVVLPDSEDEDAEISSKQGRNLQEEGLDEMVASQRSKSVDKGKRYKRRKESKGKDIDAGFEDISTGFKDIVLEALNKLKLVAWKETAKQVHLDALLAKRLAEEEELTEQQKKRKTQVQFEAQVYTEEDRDAIRAKLEANAKFTKDVLGKDLSNKILQNNVDLVKQQKEHSWYMSFGAMLQDYKRGSLFELYRLVICRNMEQIVLKKLIDRVLLSDLMTMFDPPLNEDAIWSLPLQQKMISWRYYDKCAVHCLTLEACK